MSEPTFNPEVVLEFQFNTSEHGMISIRDYLKELLVRLLRDGEAFSGKRPFGNSGWEYEIAAALIDVRAIDGTLDEDGRAEDFDWPEYHAAMRVLALAL